MEVEKTKDCDELIKTERMKVYEEIIELCEFHKKKLMNLSIPMRERSMNIVDDIIGYCNKHKDNEVEEIKSMEDK